MTIQQAYENEKAKNGGYSCVTFSEVTLLGRKFVCVNDSEYKWLHPIKFHKKAMRVTCWQYQAWVDCDTVEGSDWYQNLCDESKRPVRPLNAGRSDANPSNNVGSTEWIERLQREYDRRFSNGQESNWS